MSALHYYLKEKQKHEDISVRVFQKMLKDNPTVLAEFIDNGLTRKHVRLVEEMINPPRDLNDLQVAPDRPFLYEVYNILLYYYILSDHHVPVII